jgi:4-hydroxybenzoate polyprenyltransferase
LQRGNVRRIFWLLMYSGCLMLPAAHEHRTQTVPETESCGEPVQLTFLGSVTPVMHAFWDVDEDSMKQQETIQFFKNLMLVGALLFYLGMKRSA